MRKIFKPLIIAILLLNFGQTILGNSPEFNILRNFNFLQEERNWFSWGEKPTYEVRDRFNRVAVAKGIGAMEQTVSVEPNTSYSMLIGMKVEIGTKVIIGIKGVTNAVNEQYKEIEGTSKFQSTFSLNIETGDLNNLVVYIYRPYTDSNIEVDFISFGPSRNQQVYPNLVENPSFETGDFSNWLNWSKAPKIANLPINRYDGKKGVQIVGQSSLYQNIKTVPGKTYKFISFSRPEAGSYVNLGVKPTLESPELYRTNRHSDAWTRTEFFFTAKEESTLIYAYLPKEGHTAVVDNFIVQEVDSAERIANGSFVSKYNQYGLSNWSKYYGVEINEDGFSNNVNSIMIPSGTKISQTVPVLPNSTYAISADMKSVFSNENIRYELKVIYKDNIEKVISNFTSNQDWTKVTQTVKTRNAPIKIATLFIDGKGEVANVSLRLLSTEQSEPLPLTEKDALAKSIDIKEVKAYPIPCTDKLNVQLNGVYNSLTLYNFAGQVLLKQPIEGSGVITIPVDQIPSGTPFLVRLTGDVGYKTITGITK